MSAPERPSPPPPGLLTAVRRTAGRLAQLEIVVLPLLILAGMLSSRLLPAAVYAAAGFWFLRWAACGRPSRRTPVDGAALLLAAMLPVTLWASTLPAVTLPQVYRLLSGMALFYAIANWAGRDARLRMALAAASLAGLGLALFAAVSVEWPVGKLPFMTGELYARFAVLVSDAVHPNVLAGSLALLLPLPAAGLLFAWRGSGWPERLLNLAACLAMAACIGLTQSRGAWMAAAAALFALLALRWRWAWLLLVPAAALGAWALSHFGANRLVELAFSSGAIGGWDGREEIWLRALFMLGDFPFTGVGLGLFPQVVDSFYPFYSYTPGSIYHAHNLFLQIGVDLGIPGLVAWLGAWLATLAGAWQVYRHGRAQHQALFAALGAGVLCSQAALAMHGLTDAVVWGMVRPAPLVWAVWSLAAAALITQASEGE